ncbi:hypothetical protein [Scytonema sp. NUACC21]
MELEQYRSLAEQVRGSPKPEGDPQTNAGITNYVYHRLIQYIAHSFEYMSKQHQCRITHT